MNYIKILAILSALIINSYSFANSRSEIHLNGKCLSALELQKEYPKFQFRPSDSGAINGRGLLFKVNHPDRPEVATNYVYGTIHTDLEMETCAERAFGLPANSKIFLAETDQSKGGTEDYLEAAMLPDGKSLKDYLSAEEYEKFLSVLQERQQATREQIESTIFVKFKPWAAMQFFMKDAGMPQELELFNRANRLISRANKKTVKEVVVIEQMMDLVRVIDGFPLEDHFKLFTEALKDPDKTNEMREKTIGLWMRQDIGQIYADSTNYENSEHPEIERKFIEQTLFARSKKMADVAIEQFARGSVFMAVGASHLAGEEGILKLLQNEGFEVSPVFDRISQKSLQGR